MKEMIMMSKTEYESLMNEINVLSYQRDNALIDVTRLQEKCNNLWEAHNREDIKKTLEASRELEEKDFHVWCEEQAEKYEEKDFYAWCEEQAEKYNEPTSIKDAVDSKSDEIVDATDEAEEAWKNVPTSTCSYFSYVMKRYDTYGLTDCYKKNYKELVHTLLLVMRAEQEEDWDNFLFFLSYLKWDLTNSCSYKTVPKRYIKLLKVFDFCSGFFSSSKYKLTMMSESLGHNEIKFNTKEGQDAFVAFANKHGVMVKY